MRLKTGIFVALGVATVATAPAAAACPAARAQGQVVKLERARAGAVLLQPSGKARRPLQPFEYLCSGDTVVVMDPGARALLRLTGRDKPVLVDSVRRRFTVAAAQSTGLLHWLAMQVDRFEQLIGDNWGSRQPVETMSRVELGDPPPPLAAHPALAAHTQLLPEGLSTLGLQWRGGASKLRLNGPAGGDEIRLRPDMVSAIVPLDNEVSSVTLQPAASGTALTYEIRRVPAAAIPAPGDDRLGTLEGDERRLALALWLIEEGPPEWRLYALSELGAMATRAPLPQRLWALSANVR